MTWFSFKLITRLSSFLILLAIIIFGGTLGFIWLENYSLVDAFYMTVITISTVGFGEVQELSENGKLFTAGLIITSFGTFAYAITSITTYLVGGEYKQFVKNQKFMKDLSKLKNHVIVCGFGRVGKQVASDLATTNTPFVVIEQNLEVIAEFEEIPGYLFFKGNATIDENLFKVNLKEAKAVICALPKDTDNLYVVLSARERSSKVTIVSRAVMMNSISKLKFAGANNVILPDTIGGSHMASLITNPDVMEFLDMVRVQGRTGSNINSVAFSELPENLQNKTIGELNEQKLTGVSIIGYKTPDGSYIVNPPTDVLMVPDSSLFVLGSEEQLAKLKSLFGLTH
jgi:voltage-gated potassium channel